MDQTVSEIAGALDISGQAIIDGEVGVIHEGRTNFSEFQAELAAGRQDRQDYRDTARAYMCSSEPTDLQRMG